MFFFIGCQKKTINDLSKDNFNKNEIEQKVNLWLNEQSSKLTSSIKKEKIKLIQQNLDFDKSWMEDLQKTEKMVIVPIKDGFTTKVNRSIPVNNYLLVFLNQTSSVRKVQLIQYHNPSKQEKTSLPVGFLNKLYDGNFPTGKFTYITISNTDVLQIEVNNENETLKSLAKPISIPVNSNNSSTTTNSSSSCIDWYLETTYYYANGTTERELQYLFTTCGDNDDDTVAPGDWGG